MHMPLLCSFGVAHAHGFSALSRSGLGILGPATKTVCAAALAFNTTRGNGVKQLAGIASTGGYSALLSERALQGAHIGTFAAGGSGPSTEGATLPLRRLCDAALAQLRALCVTLAKADLRVQTFSHATERGGRHICRVHV